MKIMASGPITSWEIDDETVSDFFGGCSKITADGDCSHEIKRRLLLGRKIMTSLDSIFKSRDRRWKDESRQLLSSLSIPWGAYYGFGTFYFSDSKCYITLLINPPTNFNIFCWNFSLVVPGEGNGTPLQYSCLEHPKDGGAWWAKVHGVAKSRTQLSDFTHLKEFINDILI